MCGKGRRVSVTIRNVRLAVISEGTSSWPLYVAEARGFFQRAGIDVDMTVTGSSVKQLEQLIAGGYDIGFQQSDHVVRAVESGGDLFAFMAFAHAPELSLIVAPQIASFDDLRNGTIVVDGARTGYALLLRKLLADHGLSANDYRMQEFGGSISAEHGIGLDKKAWLHLCRSDAEIAAMRRLKAAFDPAGTLNPGKQIPTLHRCAEYGRMHVKRGLLAFPELERF